MLFCRFLKVEFLNVSFELISWYWSGSFLEIGWEGSNNFWDFDCERVLCRLFCNGGIGVCIV